MVTKTETKTKKTNKRRTSVCEVNLWNGLELELKEDKTHNRKLL